MTMNLLNSYATLADFKNWKEIEGTDNVKDGDIKIILDAVSREFEDRTSRTFYPRIETHYFDVPEERELCLDDDLLEVLTLTNGDGTSLSSTYYNPVSKNKTPYYGVRILETSIYQWMPSTTSGDEGVISLSGLWGYHDRYTQRAWLTAGTLGAAIVDTTTASLTMTAGHAVQVGKVYRVDNELFNVTDVVANVVTLHKRGDNGSTAATHLNGATVYEWQVMAQIKTDCLTVAYNIYSRRFGENAGMVAAVTGAGVVLSPRDFPQTVTDRLKRLAKKL